jgi:hypothetical protein
MAFIPAANALQVRMFFDTVTGDMAQSGFWVSNSVAWTPTTVGNMMLAFISWFNTGDGSGHSYKDQLSQDCSLVEVTARDYTTRTGISLATNTGLPIVGGIASAQQAPGLTFALTARTGLAGPSMRGRTFLVGMPLAAWQSSELGSIQSTVAANAVTAFNTLITAVTTSLATAKLCVASFRSGGAPRASGVLTPVTGYGFHNLLQDFQRRRSPAHHRHH